MKDQNRDAIALANDFMAEITDYESARDYIRIQLMSSERVSGDMVSRQFCDGVRIIYRIVIGNCMATVSESLARHWNMSESELYENTLAAPHEIRMTLLSEALSGMTSQEVFPEADPLVISYGDLNCGSGAIVYPGVIEKIAEWAGGCFFILPSSVHELLILPESTSPAPEELCSIVLSVNADESIVRPGDKLADDVFRFDEESGTITSFSASHKNS